MKHSNKTIVYWLPGKQKKRWRETLTVGYEKRRKIKIKSYSLVRSAVSCKVLVAATDVGKRAMGLIRRAMDGLSCVGGTDEIVTRKTRRQTKNRKQSGWRERIRTDKRRKPKIKLICNIYVSRSDCGARRRE